MTKIPKELITKIVDRLFHLFVITSLAILSLPNFISTKIGTILLDNSASSSDISNAWGGGDAGFLLDVAHTWSNIRQLDEETQFWIVRSWSPGMSLIETILIWFEGLVPIFWSLLAVTITIWSYIFYLYWKKFVGVFERVLLLIIFIGLLLSWDFKYMFVDYLFYTEALAYGFLFLGLSILSFDIVLNSNINSRKIIILAGLLIGFSVWIRHTSDTGLFLLLFATALLVRYINNRFRKSNTVRISRKNIKNKKFNNKYIKEKINSLKFKLLLKQILTVALIAIAVTLPWRIIGMVVYGNPAPLMSGADKIVGPGLWALPGSERANYWGPYGQNWACNIDFDKCNEVEIQKAHPDEQLVEAVKTALFNPLEYAKDRVKYFFKHWIPGFGYSPSIYNLVALAQMLVPFISLVLFSRIRNKNKYVITLLWCSFLIMNVIQLLVIHFESRYFIPVRILSIGWLINLFALYRAERREVSTANSIIKQKVNFRGNFHR